ncbi:MAG: HD-GYP domain-containing protein [Candidatus Jettenia sp. CY-1]|nr:MAG: HD-GYP domain-containing protein [Candidatus Jettenia sp. CY-1]
MTQERQLIQQVIDLGQKGIAALADRVRDILIDQPMHPYEAPRQILANGNTPIVYHTGRFVDVQFYDKTSAVIAESSAPSGERATEVRSFMASQPFVFPQAGQIQTKTVHIGRKPFFFLVISVTDRQGAVVAYGRGLFAISLEMRAKIRRTIIRNMIIVVAIVFLVTALLCPVILHLMRRLADYSTSLIDANLETISVLGNAIAKRDSDTDAHNYRVTLYAARIGETVGLNASEMRTLIKGSFLHDVGKIGIPDNILLKPARLDELEFKVMQTHVNQGVEIAGRSSWLHDSIDVIKYHHKKYSGGGYPDNIRGEQIPMAARIFAITDVFDALTSARPYKKPIGFKETMEILERGKGTHFDPKLLDAFGIIARSLYDKYSGHEGDELR